MDVALTLANELVIADKLRIMKRKLPASMQHMKSIPFDAVLSTACYYQGFTYICINNKSISRIDGDGNQTKNFLRLPNRPITVRAHQDQLLVLIKGQPYQIMVFDLHGQQMKSWNHTDRNASDLGNKLCIIDNQIITVDVTNQRISVYSLEGKTERQIPCSQMQNNAYVSMCAAGDDSVIITTSNPSAVLRFNMSTSAVIWKTELTEKPYCSTMYNVAVLVGKNGCNNSRGVWITVLNYETGEKIVSGP